jgi:uncharacterized protein (UPF0335 family)
MADAPAPTSVESVSAGQLRSFVERIERLEEEKKGLQDDIKDIYAEAKGTGFDVKVLRKLISLRKMKREDRIEQDELLEIYKEALGMG